MRKVQDFLPFIFPLAALILVVILAVRWYRLRNSQVGQISEFAEGVQIEDLSQEERDKVLRGSEDMKRAEMQKVGDGEEAVGDIGYEYADGKVRFTVYANLVELKEGFYQVWLKDPNSDSVKKAFVLEMSKGGYTGSAAVSEEALPFEVVVSREMTDDNSLETVVLKGKIEKMDKSN